jgi:arylsulfatase A-like enzyme
MEKFYRRRSFLKLFGIGISSMAFAGIGCISNKEKTKKPNLIILYADDVGYGDLGCYGNPTIKTPHLDRMAAEGLRLTSFYAAPTCTPSRVALLTGRYQVRTGFGTTWRGGVGSTSGIPENEILLPELLKEQNYQTKMVGKWHLGYNEKKYLPTNNGFDSWFGLPYSNDMVKPWVQTDVPLQLYRDTEPIEYPVDQSTLTSRYTEEAINFIRSTEDKPFFLYLAYSMAHLPIHTTDRFKGKSRAGLYGDVIETLDWSVGQVLQILQEKGIDQNTLVMFASDNGPWLNLPKRMLQQGNEPWHAGSPGPFRNAKATTYEGGVRVPCIFRWPGQISKGVTSADIVANLDIFPTFVKLAGGQVPSDRSIDGKNIFEFLKGKTSSPRKDFFYLRSGRRLEAVRVGEWKLRLSNAVQEERLKNVAPLPELFHLNRDPSERYNLASEHPEIVEQLKKSLRGFAHETGAEIYFE